MDPKDEAMVPEEVAVPEQGQFRAIWVDSWNAGMLTPEQTAGMIETAAASGCNALIVEVRKAADACYDSSFEPRAENLADGYDPLADIVEKAHARGIEVHAWLVTYRAWKGENPPQSPDHIYHTHPEWMTRNFAGESDHPEGFYLDPGVPEAQEHIANVFIDVAKKYPVDGLHFDYVRYPGRDWGYNPIAVARFQEEFNRRDVPTPDDPDWCNWRRAQVTTLVRKIYVNAMAVSRKLKITASTITWGTFPKEYHGTSAYATTLQDWSAWMEEGILDANIPMNYKRESDPEQAKDFKLWCQGAVKRSFDRHVYMGLGPFINPIAKTLTQIRKAMSLGCQGLVFFSYHGTNSDQLPREQFYETLAKKVFTQPAAMPEMPWKTRPTAGMMRGMVRDKHSEKPIPHARVWLAGTSLTALTDGTGYYAFPSVPPGIYNISVSKSGYATMTQQGTAVVAGNVTTMEIIISK